MKRRNSSESVTRPIPPLPKTDDKIWGLGLEIVELVVNYVFDSAEPAWNAPQ